MIQSINFNADLQLKYLSNKHEHEVAFLDMANEVSVMEFSDFVLEKTDCSIDILINNAGMIGESFD